MLSCEPSEHAAAFLLSVSLQTVQMRRQVVPARMSLWELARGVGRQVDLTVTVNILDLHGAFGTFLIIAALVQMLHPQKVRWRLLYWRLWCKASSSRSLCQPRPRGQHHPLPG